MSADVYAARDLAQLTANVAQLARTVDSHARIIDGLETAMACTLRDVGTLEAQVSALEAAQR